MNHLPRTDDMASLQFEAERFVTPLLWIFGGSLVITLVCIFVA